MNTSNMYTSKKISLNITEPASITRISPELFSHTTTGLAEPAFPVALGLRFDRKKEALLIEFDFDNDAYLEQNNYTDDNSALWNQEVFEFFISPGNDTPLRYLEVQVNPMGALFSAWVSNPDGKGEDNTLHFFDGRAEGIEATVSKRVTAWSGRLTLPLAILGSMQNQYRINFFRIVSFQAHDPASNWACNSDSCAFLAWCPTLSGTQAVFHIPAFFGELNLT